uniref:Uncharacterized protein n=1 Tax=Rhizophora mucronata TaxID=61149 RepID=A0A2P2K862_RHIMU
MAATPSSSLLLLNSPVSTSSLCHRPYTQSRFCLLLRDTAKTNSLSTITKAQKTDVCKEDIVIVGAGIAGLATAVSLHRSCISHTLNCYHIS